MSSPMTNENRSNKTTEEVTTALLKKRSRRVSFAENTSVLIFDRDESGSSPDPAPSNSSNEKDDSGSRQFFRTEDEDDDNDDDPDELGPPSPFIRVVASPSSGGSTIPSATSNDDDNFFGPVSSSFIRRDLSDSSSSDENHDQTMDSTAFSMHYRSIARSEAGELKTSTGINLSFEEKTPTPRSIDSNTSAMILTLTDKRKPNSIPNVSTSKMSPGSQINDMSLVGKYSNKYDYGKVSPPMNALLAEDDCDLHAASHVSLLKSPIKAGKKILADKENGPDLMDLSHDEDTKIEGIINHEELTEVVSANHIEMGLADDGSKLFTSKQPVLGVFPNTSDTQASKSLSPNQSTKATLTETNSSLELLATSQSTPSKYGNIAYRLDDVMEKENKLPLIGAIAHSTDRPSAAATPLNRTMVFQRTDSLQHVGSVSSLQKSISKLRSLEASPFSAGLTTLTTKLKNSNFKSLVSKMTPLGTLLENNIVSPQVNSMDRGEIEIMDICLENPLPNMVANKNQIPKNDVCTTRNQNLVQVEAQLVLQSEIASGVKMQPTVSKCANIRDDDITNVRMDEISCQKNLAEQFGRSPSDKELCDTFHNDNIDSLHVDNMQSSVRKRKSENVMPTEKIVKIKTSSNSGVELPSGSGTSNIGPTLEHLTQIHTRFFKETKLLPDSVDKMNLHAIDRLIDTLGQLQTSKTYELLASKFQSHDIQNKRAIEAKLLLCKIVHEKAKSQLLHVKRERLLKNGQSLASGIQESEVLKLNLSLQNSLPAQVIPHRTDNIKEIQECQVDIDKVKSMRQVIKDMDERILSLTKSFHGSCKMKGEPPNPTDTIANVNDHLLKRARCHIIRKDMQLWVIDDFKSSKDHHEITLNYLNFMSQRITVTAGVIPSFSFSHSLNQTNINKIFKDMDASAAFGFVFNGGLIQKYVGATSLAQETQITSHLFGNLVDVLDEIQLARLELPNLMRARFHTSLDEQLHLELYFFNATSGKKATVSLNTSCLKRGIYPPEIAPCQIDIAENASQNSSTQTLSAQITAAVKDLRVGYLRIKRLCRCVSQLVGIQ